MINQLLFFSINHRYYSYMTCHICFRHNVMQLGEKHLKLVQLSYTSALTALTLSNIVQEICDVTSQTMLCGRCFAHSKNT